MAKLPQRPSKLLGILDWSLALDFDLSVARKLREWKDKRQEAFAALIATHLATVLLGGKIGVKEMIERMP